MKSTRTVWAVVIIGLFAVTGCSQLPITFGWRIPPAEPGSLLTTATFSKMADALIEWEGTHPGVDPR